ncbi:sigma-70 family RNA polymerase sigma factor [uncultured Croceitalea sp.]|uniref:sigma-70 family RNA polymerase sigma factor n=1 Tax=uncultured Croceitalea sp. TaxID=1798908 RepID=UPI00374F5DCC
MGKIHIINKDVLKILFDAYYKPLVIYARSFNLIQAECEDLAQEVFIGLWKEKVFFTNEKVFRSYIYKNIKNKCLNAIKHKKVIEKYAIQTREHSEVKINPFNSEIELEIVKTLHRAIEILSPRRKQVIKLTLQGFRNNQIAEQMKIQLQTVKTLKSQAYHDLRNYFRELKIQPK